MRLLLSNGDYVYSDNSSSRLLDLDGKASLVGEEMYFNYEGEVYKLTSSSPTYLLNYDIVTSNWVETSYYINSDNLPNAINADDTYNFEGFGLPLLLTSLFAVFIVFNVFKRGWFYDWIFY